MTITVFLTLSAISSDASPNELTREAASDALQKAVRFFREHASASGSYVYRISSDLTKREGEGKVGATTGWIEPPGTPSVGIAYLQAYQLTGEAYLLEAAVEVGNALVQTQLVSGGWDNGIEFDPEQPSRSSTLSRQAADTIAALDDRGAWVEPGRMRYHGEDDDTRQVIESRTFARNVVRLARFISAQREAER